MSRGERQKDAQKLATMLHVLPPTLKPVNNLICCKRGLIWVVKCATALFNSRHCNPYPVQQHTHLSRAYKGVSSPGPSWQTVDGKEKKGMKARENAIGRGKREKDAQKRANCIALLQNKLRIASLLTDAHTWPKSKLQVRKGMSLFTFSKPALGIKLQRIFEVLF